mgnify:CR=1 FL=1
MTSFFSILAHVFALYGSNVKLIDIDKDVLTRAVGTIEKNLGRQVKKEVITEKIESINQEIKEKQKVIFYKIGQYEKQYLSN